MSEFERNSKRLKYEFELKTCIEKHTYSWFIYDLLDEPSPEYNRVYITSPVFLKSGSKYKWQIHCQPNPKAGCTSFSLIPRTPCEYPIFSILSIRNCDEEILYQNEANELISRNAMKNGRFNPINQLTNIKNDCLKYDTLEIRVIISVEIISRNISFSQFPQAKELQDFESVLKNKTDTDFVLKVKDFELSVHKAIISACCPVFFSMLKNDTLERKESSMYISDVDKNILILLVDFIYTGNVTTLSYNEAKKLLYAANKYLLTDLEEICENRLIEELSVTNVIDVLIIADLCYKTNLKAEAIDFIVQQRWKLDSSFFQKLAMESKVFKEVLLKFMGSKSRKTEIDSVAYSHVTFTGENYLI